MPSMKKRYEQQSSENQGSPSWMQPSTSRHARDVSTEEIEMDELFNHRTQIQEKEYTPLEMKDILERERRERIRAWWSDHLRDFLTFFIYLITLYCAVFGSRDDMAYYSTSSIKNTIVYSDIFSEITSTKVFLIYMSEVLIPALHQGELYNHEKINETGITAVYDTKLLGLVRLRQLRVKNETCNVATELRGLRGRCRAQFSFSTEDTKNYSLSWSPFVANSFKLSRNKSPWLYRTGWESGTVLAKGEFAWYPGGGYITTLGRTLENSLTVMKFLKRYNWFDHHTRAIFIDFTTYNANRNIFNVVNLIVEISAEGAVVTSQNIETLKLLLNYHELRLSTVVAMVLCSLMLCVFIVRQMTRFGRTSVRSYFTAWYNIIDMIIALLGITIVGLYLLRSKYVSMLIKHLEEADGNEYVNFTWAAYWQVTLLHFIAALLCMSTFRAWKLLRFGRQFRSFEHTLIQASKALVPVTFIMVIVVIGFTGIAYVIIGHTSYPFSKMYYTFSTLFFNGIGLGELDYEVFFAVDYIIGPVFIIIYWLTFIIFLINVFITVINLAYENARDKVSLIHEEYTMTDYVKEEIKYHFTHRK